MRPVADDVAEVTFNAALFANRKKERELFLETVHAAVQQTYLEFNGVAGQGKSELLKWIYAQAKAEGYLAAYIDLELSEYYRPEIYPILKTIANQLAAQTTVESFDAFYDQLALYQRELQKVYRHAYESGRPEVVDQRPLQPLEDMLVHTFNESLNRLLTARKIVLALDSTERVHRQALRSFEEQILTPCVKHHNFMLITAGQEELVWKNTHIRNMVKRCNLEPFDSESLRDQVQKLAESKGFRLEDDQTVLNAMLDLTLGHPFSTYKLVDFWTHEFQQSLNKQVVADQDRFVHSIRKLVEEVITERILGKFQLSKEYPPVKRVLWHLAPLRHIELSMFRYILSNCAELAEQFQGKSFLFYERLIGEFQNTYIFTQWRLGSGFNLDPVVRNVLLWDMRVNHRDYFLNVQQNLAERYDQWVGQTRDATQIKNMVERLYHYAISMQETEPDKVNMSVQTELQRYLDAYFTLTFTGSEEALRDQLNRLSNVLERDKELNELLDMPGLLEMIHERKGSGTTRI